MARIGRLAKALGWRIVRWWAARTHGRGRRAATLRRPLRRLLAVCYENIIRSPYAAELLSHRLAGIATVRSAGFHRMPGRPSPAPVIAIARRAGLDLSSHRSSVVTAHDPAKADAVVLMDRHNWQALRQLGADQHKLIWLGAQDGCGDMTDPYGRPEGEMASILSRLRACAESLATAIILQHTKSADSQ